MKKLFLVAIFASLQITGCGTNSNIQYLYQTPEDLDDGLAVGSLDELHKSHISWKGH